MTDIVYGIRITGEASSAKKAFEETRDAQQKLTGAERDSARAAVEIERANERKTAALNRVRLAAVAVGVAMIAMARSTISAAVEAERSQNRLAAVIRATGGAAGLAGADYKRMADSLAEATQFEGDSLLAAQATLLKFGNIHGEVFTNALRLSADLAAFLGTDVPSAAQMLGRTLQSPTEGLQAMEMQFGKLNEAQEENINNLVKQGRAWEAQRAVLDLWQQKIGGAAQTMNTGLGQATNDVRKEWNELLETMGKSGTVMNRSLQGGASLLRDVRLTLEGTRNPLRDLLDTTVEWAAALRFIPGPIGMIGNIANAQAQAASRARRTATGRIDYGGGAEEAGLAAHAGPLVLGGSNTDALARERERARSRAEVAAGLAESLTAQQAILDEASDLGVKFLQQQDEKRAALEKEAQAVRDTLDPWNAYAREVERLRGLLDKGVISQREFVDAVALEARKVGGAFDELAAKGTQSFDELKNAIEGWGQDLSRELARGEIGIQSFSRLFEELLAMQINKRAVQPFLAAGTSFIDELLKKGSTSGAYTGNAAPFHTGRGPGEFGAPRVVHSAYFQRAPRLHGGIGPGEMPAIIRQDESVLTPGQMRAMGGGAPSFKVNVINRGEPADAEPVGSVHFDRESWVATVVLKHAARNAGFREQLAGMLAPPRH